MNAPLDLSAPLRTVGRPKGRALAWAFVRELSQDDLAMLSAARGSVAKPLARIRDSHHRLARALASGMSNIQAGAVCGFSQSRVSILKQDQQFLDLIEVYRKSDRQEFLEYQDIALGNMIRSERLLEDSLQHLADSEAPLALSEVRPLLEIISDRADRFGYPKKTANLNLNVDFAGQLSAARKRSGLVLEATPLPAPASQEPVSDEP